ncbi:hypothetical protein BX616_000839 [Lobosporangium transversale]|uniref:F-box domain-containing protein n=1 Tax=Lobosporangium transversale TaxID=64571 RepID=A0A1Y2H0G1_9FUNG|nr:hypothetical protein BCR41DRAFT_392509 [Lobosporangium transversale]KAF9919151.1 hypothetical protein BX616_000839 [Lobosporangium transversale]ORZ28049.1 hypothetical protein BCR41DRAFT_392509 [Lobosporangium transversale]|eukprot:XP_021885752.1 hypothetical protein BCR41DRAFT_392509 [Lobosporangium transversale]
MASIPASESLPSSSSNSPSNEVLQLPELLEKIATYVSHTDTLHSALVCKTWGSVFTANLWRKLNMPPIHKSSFINGLLHRGHHVRSLTLVGQFDHMLFYKSCPQLTLLDLTLAQSLNVFGLHNMARCLPNLKILRLNCCYGQSLSWLGPLTQLECLEEFAMINDMPEYSQSDVPSISEHEQSLYVQSLDEASNSVNTDVDPDEMLEADQGFSYVAIEEVEPTDTTEELDLQPDYLGEFLIARAATLTNLSLEGLDLLGFKLFKTYSQTNSVVKDATTPTSSPCATESSIIPTISIKRLNLSKIGVYHTSSVIEPLLMQCHGLETLDISGNFEKPWDMFQWSLLPRYCLKLTSLNLGQLSSIDNDQLVQVVRCCPGFRSLLAPQSNLHSKVLDAIVDRWLETLHDLGGAREFTVQKTGFLELDISWCSEIKQESVQRLLKHVSTLKSFRCSWCQQIDLSLFQLEWSCLGLIELEAQGLDKPTTTDDEFSCSPEVHMFKRISQFSFLRHLAIGSDEVMASITNGFELLGLRKAGNNDEQTAKPCLNQLQYLSIIGHEESPLGISEMSVVASSFPQLRHFHFGLGLVSPEMQTWLAGQRPDVHQEEQRIYY